MFDSDSEQSAEPDIMTWFPRREDYEIVPEILEDETYDEKLIRLMEAIETAQALIKEVVDGDTYTDEEKIYITMDIGQDLEMLTELHKECEADKDAKESAEALKKCKVGLINLQSYLKQVDLITFATAIRDRYKFKLALTQIFGPWLDDAEKRVVNGVAKPLTFDQARDTERQVCIFLKEVVKANKVLKEVQAAADGIKGDVSTQGAFSKLSERYFVLCKKAELRVKNVQQLIIEWKRLDDFLEPTNPFEMDDYQTKQFIVFLRCYAAYFA